MINIFFSARYRVEGDSMLPSLVHWESVLVVGSKFRWNRLRRGDVVVFQRPEGNGGVYIKRLVGLPGEDLRVAGGRVFLDGTMLEENYIQEAGDAEDSHDREWFNGPGEYFLLGDNRAESNGSRSFGPVPAGWIKGRAWFLCWPPRRWQSIHRY